MAVVLLVPLVGIACMVLGGLIVTFDYPQILYLEELGAQGGAGAVQDTSQMYGRLVVEFYVGMAVLAAGALLCASPVLSGIRQKRIGQR